MGYAAEAVRLKKVARITLDSWLRAPTTLFAALKVASGKVHGRCYPRRELHLTLDNYGTHKHPKVREWLEAHPRVHFHLTPTNSSWLNLVDRWFGLITDQAIRCGSLDGVPRLIRTIMSYLDDWNPDAKPFRWLKTPTEIRRKLRRVTEISDTRH